MTLVASSTSGPDISVLYQYGAVGLMALLALSSAWVLYKRLVASHDEEIAVLKEQLQREKDRGDRLEVALAELNSTVRTQVMVALAEAQRAVTDAIARMRNAR